MAPFSDLGFEDTYGSSLPINRHWPLVPVSFTRLALMFVFGAPAEIGSALLGHKRTNAPPTFPFLRFNLAPGPRRLSRSLPSCSSLPSRKSKIPLGATSKGSGRLFTRRSLLVTWRMRNAPGSQPVTSGSALRKRTKTSSSVANPDTRRRRASRFSGNGKVWCLGYDCVWEGPRRKVRGLGVRVSAESKWALL